MQRNVAFALIANQALNYFSLCISASSRFLTIKKGRRKTWISNRNPAIADLSFNTSRVYAGLINRPQLPYSERIYTGPVSARPSYPGQPYIFIAFILLRITQLLDHIPPRKLAYPYLCATCRTPESYFSFFVLICRICFQTVIAYDLIRLRHFT